MKHKKTKKFGRGIDTVYRITLRNHVNLSSMADKKANMLIQINTLVLSLLITAGTAGVSMADLSFQKDFNLLLPVLILIITFLLATIFAIISVIPRTSDKKIDVESIKSHESSLLFFGNFIQLGKEEFVNQMRELANNDAALYDDLSRDLYHLGIVLKKKYSLLKIANQIFMAGLILSVLTFLIGCFH